MTDQPVADETPKKVPDMTKVREAKKRKQQERDSTLSDLKSQVSSMATLMKTEKPAMKPDVKPDVESDEESDEPTVVTRKKQKMDPDTPSLKSEVLKTAIVALLGLGTWYVSNIMFTPPKTNVIERIAAPVIPPVSAPPTRQPEPIKKKIGASGLLE